MNAVVSAMTEVLDSFEHEIVTSIECNWYTISIWSRFPFISSEYE